MENNKSKSDQLEKAINAKIESFDLHEATACFEDDDGNLCLDIATYHGDAKQENSNYRATESLLASARELFNVIDNGDGDGQGCSINCFILEDRAVTR